MKGLIAIILSLLTLALVIFTKLASSEPRTLESSGTVIYETIPESYASSIINFIQPTEPQVELVRISTNGSVTYHPKLSIDGVSRKIYEAIGNLARKDCRANDPIFTIYGDEPK